MGKTRISAEPGIPQIIVTREFDAPRELVFRAYTDPDLLVRWLGPRELTLAVDRYELHDGLRTTLRPHHHNPVLINLPDNVHESRIGRSLR